MLSLLGVLLSFIIIIHLIRYKFNFGLSLIAGSILLGVFSLNKIDAIEIPKAMIQASFYSFEKNVFFTETIELAILMTLIFMLAKLMQETKAITKLIDSLRTIFTKGGTLGVVPAIYGLMPVPGGALFSAPVVEEEGYEFKLKTDTCNFLNIWFRHIWFPVYPISSNIIIMSALAGITVTSLIFANLISFFVMIVIGVILLSFFIKKYSEDLHKRKRDLNNIKNEGKGLIFIIPPVIPVFFAVFHYIFDFSLIRSFIIGVLTSIIVLFYISKTPKSQFFNLVSKSITWKLAVVIFGIMIFREIFEVTRSNKAIFSMLEGFNIPAIFMIILLPILLGLVSGYLLCGITLSYPLLIPFFADTGLSILGFTSIIYMSAFVGYLVSPIHLCNVLSSDFLKTDTTRMYPVFIPASILLLVIHVVFVLTVL